MWEPATRPAFASIAHRCAIAATRRSSARLVLGHSDVGSRQRCCCPSVAMHHHPSLPLLHVQQFPPPPHPKPPGITKKKNPNFAPTPPLVGVTLPTQQAKKTLQNSHLPPQTHPAPTSPQTSTTENNPLSPLPAAAGQSTPPLLPSKTTLLITPHQPILQTTNHHMHCRSHQHPHHQKPEHTPPSKLPASPPLQHHTLGHAPSIAHSHNKLPTNT